MSSTEQQIENAANRAAKILNMDAKQAASSAFQISLNEYVAEFLETIETQIIEYGASFGGAHRRAVGVD